MGQRRHCSGQIFNVVGLCICGVLCCCSKYKDNLQTIWHQLLVHHKNCFCMSYSGRQALRHCAFTINPQRPVSPAAGHRPGWQQPWWSGMHCSPSWLQGCGRHCVSHNAPVEYKRPCSCCFHQSGACWRWPTAIQIRVETGPGCLQGREWSS